ncbi:MAG: hypothetical protein MUF18_20890 [Fimbriiglobus sp.]|nr:hypothetical protein [Fimbriiglobus sp.]
MRHDSSRTEDAYHDGCRRFILFRHPTPTASFIWPRVERAERATPWEQVHRELTVRADKGDKDRLTMLPAAEADGLREHLGGVREKHARDVAAERLLV